jgi:MFS family permease
MRKSGYWATSTVLALLCLMYLITYIDRVNISTAALAFNTELHISKIEYGWIFSAFGYTYALFQIIGGFLGDRFGPRMTLTLCGLVWALSTVGTGLAGGFWSLVIARLMLGFGEGATFPTATSAMSIWTRVGWRGFAQGITHSFSRAGFALAPALVVYLMSVWTWRGSFIALGLASLVWVALWGWYFRDNPRDHSGVSEAELAVLPSYALQRQRPPVPWRRLVPRMMPTTIVYFCYGWTLWLYLSWMPQFFQGHGLNITKSALFTTAVSLAGVIGDTMGGVISDGVFHLTGNLATARRNVVIGSFLSSVVFLTPLFFVTDVVILTLCLAAAFFCLELTIGPIWSVPMDIAPKHAGTASGIMNTGSAVAAIISPTVFGYIVSWSGSWELPFAGSIGLLLIGAVLTFWMRPDLSIEERGPELPRGSPASAV